MWVSTWFWNAPNVSLFIVPTRVSGCTTDPCTYKSGSCSYIPSVDVGRGASGTFFRLRLAMHYSERLRIPSLCPHNGFLWMKTASERGCEAGINLNALCMTGGNKCTDAFLLLHIRQQGKFLWKMNVKGTSYGTLYITIFYFGRK